METIKKPVNLPELARFNEAKVHPGELLDLSLAAAGNPICCFTSAANLQVADAYKSVIGKNNGDFSICLVDNPIGEASRLDQSGVIPLTMYSAADRTLNERMFIDGPNLGQLLMSHIYMPQLDCQSPSLYTVGVATQGLKILEESQNSRDSSLLRQMEARRKEILGTDITNDDFRKILQSSLVEKIIAHTLGPRGTNISQAMGQYIGSLGINDKTDLIVHPSGIEPLIYTQIAAQQVKEGVVPIHMECAVYYDMGRVYDQRRNEVVFADHYYMPLDAMQLASIKTIEELVLTGVMRIAAHPSPKPLINPWVDAGKAQWIRATSNSAAAEMVMTGQANTCITTASSLISKDDLITRHVFGSPMMLFTIGTPLNQQQLKNYLARL